LKNLTLILIFCTQALFAGNYDWLVSAQYTRGFDTRDISLWDAKVDTKGSNGALLSTSVQYEFYKNLNLYGGIGTRTYHIKRNAGEINFEGQVLKFFAFSGLNYKLSPKHSIGTGIQIENNAESDHFRYLNSDLVRYSFQLNYQFQLNKFTAFTTGFTSAIYPLNGVYLIENPANYISTGLNFKLF